MTPYPVAIEHSMQTFYVTLSEKDKRRYAAVEAVKLGHGGISYIARLLGCDRKTVRGGIKELQDLPGQSSVEQRIRKSGGGRKRYDETYPDIDAQFLAVLEDYTAGDPMREEVLWTNLTPREIAERLAERYGVQVSTPVVRKLLKKHRYRRRQAQKNEP